MHPTVANKLIELNHQFYQTFAKPFSSTRQRLQPGVRSILDRIPVDDVVLDLGCGNGEAWQALQHRGHSGSYVGVDFSPALLEIADGTGSASGAQARFICSDLTQAGWGSNLPDLTYDHILAFAMLHHLPGEALRRQFLTDVRRLLPSTGEFVLSVWQFLNSPRLAARIQPWELVALNPSQVDTGDYLLDWRQGGSGLRYVHHFSMDELASLARACGFRVKSSFVSDGHNGNLGLYQVWCCEYN